MKFLIFVTSRENDMLIFVTFDLLIRSQPLDYIPGSTRCSHTIVLSTELLILAPQCVLLYPSNSVNLSETLKGSARPFTYPI